MKERIRDRVVGVIYSHARRVALFIQCLSNTTYHPPVRNWFSRQFFSEAELINSIHGETVTRVAHPDQLARLAEGLKVALFGLPTILHKAKRDIWLHVCQKSFPNDGSLGGRLSQHT